MIDFDAEPSGEIVLKFEDLVEKVNIIRLETRDDLILPGYVSIKLTDDYIITIGSDRIDQFDNNGNHIRKLATKGRGPNEFNFVTHIIDQKRDRLYLVSYMGEDKIMRIDLSTGDFLDNIKPEIPIWGRFISPDGDIVGIADPNYYGMLGMKGDTLSRVYFVDAETGTTKNIAICKNSEGRSTPNIVGKGEDLFFYICSNSDTLYKISGNEVVPHKVFKISDKAAKSISNGNELRMDGFLGRDLLIRKSRKEIVEQEEYRSTTTISEEYLLLNESGIFNSFDIAVIDRFNIRQSAKEYRNSFSRDKTILYPGPVPSSSGDYLYYTFNAPNAILFLERALEDETTTDKQRKEINALLSQIDEEDNHIIIYGKRK